MSTPARRRLLRDFKKLQEDPPNTGRLYWNGLKTKGITAAPQEDNLMSWQAVIFG